MKVLLKSKEELNEFDKLIKTKLGFEYEGVLGGQVWMYRKGNLSLGFNAMGCISTVQLSKDYKFGTLADMMSPNTGLIWLKYINEIVDKETLIDYCEILVNDFNKGIGLN